MRIVHLNVEAKVAEPKKSARELKEERCNLMLANQRIKDRKDAEKFARFLEERKNGTGRQYYQ